MADMVQTLCRYAMVPRVKKYSIANVKDIHVMCTVERALIGAWCGYVRRHERGT